MQKSKGMVVAFAEFVLASALSTCLQETLFNSNSPCETFYMIVINLLINGSVKIGLTLTKKGAKIMYKKLGDSLNREHRPKMDNKMQDEAKALSEWLH